MHAPRHSCACATLAYDVLMLHRHLNHQRFTAAAVDDIIARGKWDDWAELREAIRRDPPVGAIVRRVCGQQRHDPYAQRYHFWMHYVEKYCQPS